MLDRLQQIRLNRRKKVHAAPVLGVHIFTLLFPKVTIHNGPVKRPKGSSNFKNGACKYRNFTENY